MLSRSKLVWAGVSVRVRDHDQQHHSKGEAPRFWCLASRGGSTKMADQF